MFFKVSAMKRGEVSSSITQGPAKRKKRSERKPFRKSNFVVSMVEIFCKSSIFLNVGPSTGSGTLAFCVLAGP